MSEVSYKDSHKAVSFGVNKAVTQNTVVLIVKLLGTFFVVYTITR